MAGRRSSSIAKLPKDVRTITLSYTFFEVGGKMPAEPPVAARPPAVDGEAGRVDGKT